MAGALALLASLYTLLGGPLWPTDPEIHFRDTSDGSSLRLPFDIRNKSGLFNMPNVHFRCGIDLVIAQDSNGHSVVIRDAAFVNGSASIPALEAIPYSCDAENALLVRRDGSLSLYNSAKVLENKRNTIYSSPWTIKKMRVWVGGEYQLLGFSRAFTSKIFQWPAMPGSHQWQEGRLVGTSAPEEEEERRNGLMPGALQCSDGVQFPYMLVTGTGPALLVFGPDPMGGLGIVPLAPTL